MSILNISGLTHSFGDSLLYKNADFTLNKGEHIGIVGQNGVGKSTLIRFCTQQLMPDEGRIVWHPKITFGYLDQYAETDCQAAIKAFLQSAFSQLYELEQKTYQLYVQAEHGNENYLSLAAESQEQLEQSGFYSIDTRIEQVVTGLGLSTLGLERQIGQLSGGQRAKVILAKLLLEKPDVLLLDEPTNFLDKEHIAWLADYLQRFENAFLIVSHDYDFLEKTTNHICDIDNGKLSKYTGTYAQFLKKKASLRENYIRQYASQQKEIKRTEEFIRKNIAGRNSQMAKGRRKQLERMDKMDALAEKEIKPCFDFSLSPSSAAEPLKVNRLSVGYQYAVLKNLSFAIESGQKVVITGFNGIGKSTLLKTLIGQLPALQGGFSFSAQTALGYFEQDMHWDNTTKTPMQIISDAYPQLTEKEQRKRLARCGIQRKLAVQPVTTLSGGEQAKVKLCLLTLKPCNFIIMDEPTNHLDQQAKEALQTALSGYCGTILLVSHEVKFYSGWVDRVIKIEDTQK